MRTGTRAGLLLGAVALAGGMAMAAPAGAHDVHRDAPGSTGNYADHTTRVPDDPTADQGSDVNGRAKLHYNAETGELSVFVAAHGLSPNVPHLIHIHGDTQVVNDCPGPDAADRRVDDGLIDTVEGLPDYGPILVTFSTSGGTGDMSSPDALDLSRAPVSDSEGNLYYARTFPITADVAANLDHLHIVIHGLDLDHNTQYDGSAGSLGPDVPLEAELPVSCGPLQPKTPAGHMGHDGATDHDGGMDHETMDDQTMDDDGGMDHTTMHDDSGMDHDGMDMSAQSDR